MKRKLLVCGSAGFLMSNFIRYLLYRSKDYEIASVDWLKDPEKDSKYVYIHRSHRFYIGNAADHQFMSRLAVFEKPDVIVNAIGHSPMERPLERRFDLAVDAANICSCLGRLGIPVVQLVHAPEADSAGGVQLIANMMLESKKNTLLVVPNCFGMRQKPTEGLARIIHSVINGKILHTCVTGIPLAYAEDVASLVWFIIERGLCGEIQMPCLGSMHAGDIVEVVEKTLGIKANKREDVGSEERESPSAASWGGAYDQRTTIDGWVSDSESLEASLEKTIRWYAANRWALHV